MANRFAPAGSQWTHQIDQPIPPALFWMAPFLLAPAVQLHFCPIYSTLLVHTVLTHVFPSAFSASPGTCSSSIPPHAGCPPLFASALVSALQAVCWPSSFLPTPYDLQPSRHSGGQIPIDRGDSLYTDLPVSRFALPVVDVADNLFRTCPCIPWFQIR